QDAGRHARPLSLEGSSRRCHRLHEYGWDGRDVRATGRASRRPGRERGTVMKSSRWKMARHFGIEMTVNGSTPAYRGVIAQGRRVGGSLVVARSGPGAGELEPDVLVDLKPVTLFWGAGAAGAKRYLERQLEA